MPTKLFPNNNYELDHDSALQSQNQGGNFSTVYTRTIVRKLRGTGFAGSDGWNGWVDSNLGGFPDIWQGGGSTWTFQNGQSSGDWWYHSGTFNVPHDENGYGRYWTNSEFRFGSSVGQTRIDLGWRDLPRIPKKPSQAGTPYFSETLPTSLRVSWGGSGDNGGSDIKGYLLRYWPNAEGSGNYVDHSFENNTSRMVYGLTPGTVYRFVVFARNSSADNNGYSIQSGANTIRMLSGGRVKINGAYRLALPYVKHGGVWRIATPFVKHNGIYRITQ